MTRACKEEPVHLSFRLLGPMEILKQGQPIGSPAAAERALLVQLLLSPGRTIPATSLVDRLWSDSALPVDPMNALQTRASKLRRALKAGGVTDVVVREGSGYRATVEATAVDAVDFELRVREARARSAVAGTYDELHLRAYDDALALWRGEPLSGFAGEQWATGEATRLTGLRLAALTERAQVALGLGRHTEVVADLEPLVANDPTQESLAALLMLAMYRSGRQADALQIYSRTRDVLDERLGLEPSVSLRSLQERILRQDPGLGARPDLVSSAPLTPPQRPAEERTTTPTNLPTALRPLIGRDDQLDALSQLLAETRLVSLIGPGGAGKTALAMTAAAGTAGAFPDGAFMVRLASVTTGDQVPLVMADALGVGLDGAAADLRIRERIITYLARRRLLMFVDNCEHVVDAVAGLVDEILGHCPGVTVLATSREALAIPDEVQVIVGPLDVPPTATPPDRILAFAATQLFAERVRAVRPGTVFDEPDLLAVGRISRALDGIPLALELAAARVASMSPVEINDRLTDRFALLTSGARTAEARQRTLRATVDWSYALLTEQEQQVFNRLSVFHGGWTLSAAEAVAGDDSLRAAEVLDIIARLIERSMLTVERGRTTRYRMLETLRQYAAEQLAANHEDERFAHRHARYFRDLSQDAEPALRGPGQRDTLRWLREEQPNMRAALAWLSGPGDDHDSALAMAGSLGLFWHLGRHLEGRETLSRLLAGAPHGAPAARARALQAVSLVERPRACLVHPSRRCADAAEESLRTFEEIGDASRAALSQVLLAVEGVTGADAARSEQLLERAHEQFLLDDDVWGEAVIGFVRMETAFKNGDADRAVSIGRVTAASFRTMDDPWGLSATLYHLGGGLQQFGRFEEGARALEEAIDVAASADLYNTVQWAMADLGTAQLHLGNRDLARELFDRAAAVAEHVGDGAGATLAEYGYGLLAEMDGDWDEARARYAAAVSGFSALSTPVPEHLAIAGLARCDEADGKQGEACRRYEQVLECGRGTGEPGLTAAALEGLARLAAGEAY